MTFDKDFRPRSYFDALPTHKVILTGVTGEERRKAIRKNLRGEEQDHPLGQITEGSLEDEERSSLSKVHPAFMGGEFLPPMGQDEVEIARIVFNSVTQDVTSIRAARAKDGISYRIVTEYDDELGRGMECFIEHSKQPLTLQEMIDQINRSNETYNDKYNYTSPRGLAFSAVQMNLDNDADPESMKMFVEVHSEFYPELKKYFWNALEEFVDSVSESE